METLKGTISKIKVLKLSAPPLVRFSLDETSCLIVAHSLNFLAEVEEGNRLVVGGDFNTRHQFVVKKYCVVAPKREMEKV